MLSQQKKLTSFAKYAWFVLVFNVFVVVWGGFVSASGSGDGCGTDWPLCGNLVSAESDVTLRETLIEFIHRGTSGLALIAVVVMLVLARRRYAKGDLVRRGAWLALIFMITESLLGAGLVIFRWVDTNLSVARAIVQPIHLVNTFLLLGAIGLTAWWASGSTTVVWRSQRRLMVWLGVALLGMVFIGTFGTFASLASTIFPSESFLEGVQKDFARDEHWLIRLRIWHPIIATALGVYLVVLRQRLLRVRPSQTVETLSFAILLLYGVQYALGALNAILLSPVWLQLTHLLMTDTLWLLLIFMSAAALSGAPASDAIDRRLAAASAD